MRSFELEIQGLLIELGTPDLVADECLKRWSRGTLSFEDQRAAAKFLVHCGYYPSLFSQISKNLQEGHRIPWDTLGEALAGSRIRIKKETLDLLLQGAGDEGALEAFTSSGRLHELDPRFSKIRRELIERRWKEHTHHRQQQIDRAEIYRRDRMLTEAVEILQKLLRQHPNDHEIQKKLADLTIQDAKDLLDRKEREQVQATTERALRDHLTPEQKQTRESLINAMLEQAKKTPQEAYEIAVSLLQMDLPEGALLALEFAPSHLGSRWLRIELLVQTRRFVEALQAISGLEEELASEPETSFSASYLRAMALWGLNQKKAAIEILESIVAIRPAYRSAHALLLAWKGQIK